MRPPKVSSWKEGVGPKQRWVCQIRIKKSGQKSKTIQRRHQLKSVAHERAMEALRAFETSGGTIVQITVRQGVRLYLEALEGTIKDTTVGEYAYQLNKYFVPQCADRLLIEITSEDIRRLLKEVRSSGLSDSSVNTLRSRILGLYSFALRERLVSHNPVVAVKTFRSGPKNPSRVQPPWTVNEVREALERSEEDPIHLFLALCLFTGLRRGEALALTWGDFDEEHSLIRVSKSIVEARVFYNGEVRSGAYLQEPKTESSNRFVYCSPELKKAIYRARRRFSDQCSRLPAQNDPMVFHTNGLPYAPSSIGHRFIRFCDSNGIRRIRLHDLRHTSAVLALEAGVPLEAVSEGMGHSGVEITKRIYAPRVPGLAKRFSMQLDDFLSASDPSSTWAEPKGAKHV